MERVILVSGKGGVGKTTVAAATAIAAARKGHRTIVLSFDLAHSLADSFNLDQGLFSLNGGLPVTIEKNLDLQELDVQEEIQRHWGEVYHYMAALFTSAGLTDLVAEEVAIMPGMEDLVALMSVNQYYKDKTYDVIVVDCPPTSESLRFVNLMTTIEWYVRKRFKLDRTLVKLARPFANALTEYQLPDDGYFSSLKGIFERLGGIDELLRNPEVTTVRLVTNAEKMVVRETQRAYTYFCMYGMTTDAIIVNRLIPSAEGYFSRWAETHAAYAAEIAEFFAPIPVLRVPLFADEVVGVDRLSQVSETLFADRDAAARFIDRPPYCFDKVEDRYRLSMSLPFADKRDVDLTRMDHDLIVRIGAFKRHVTLPRSLVQYKQVQAKMEGSRLNIEFVL